jgi:hypothetical protein
MFPRQRHRDEELATVVSDDVPVIHDAGIPTIRSKGCLSNRTALAMVFKLVEAAQKNWRRLDGNNQLSKLILGVKFADGIEVAAKLANRQRTTVAA